MLKDLIKIANSLDQKGLIAEANYLDKIINKVAATGAYDEYLDPEIVGDRLDDLDEALEEEALEELSRNWEAEAGPRFTVLKRILNYDPFGSGNSPGTADYTLYDAEKKAKLEVTTNLFSAHNPNKWGDDTISKDGDMKIKYEKDDSYSLFDFSSEHSKEIIEAIKEYSEKNKEGYSNWTKTLEQPDPEIPF